MKLASCKSALNPLVVYSTDRSKAVVPVLVLHFGALWFILRGDLLYVLPCVILFLCFSVRLALRLPRLGKRELILVLFVCLIDLCLFGFVGFLFLLMSGKGCVCDCGTPWTFLLPFLPCYFVLVFFSHFSIANTSLGEERTSLGAFRTFVRFAPACFFSVFYFSWCLGRAAVCNCCTAWTFLLPHFLILQC